MICFSRKIWVNLCSRFALRNSTPFRIEEFICLLSDGVQSEDGWVNKHGELEFPWRHPGGSSHPLHHNWKDLAHCPVHISNACSGCSSWRCLEWWAVWLHQIRVTASQAPFGIHENWFLQSHKFRTEASRFGTRFFLEGSTALRDGSGSTSSSLLVANLLFLDDG